MWLLQIGHWAPTMTVVMSAVITVIMNLSVDASAMREMDEESGVSGIPGVGIKCGTCSPCQNLCSQNQPPPPPPPPKNPTIQYCPPPPSTPSSPLVYVTGIPPPSTPLPPLAYVAGLEGNVYSLDPYYSGANQISTTGLNVWVGSWLIGLLVFWGL